MTKIERLLNILSVTESLLQWYEYEFARHEYNDEELSKELLELEAAIDTAKAVKDVEHGISISPELLGSQFTSSFTGPTGAQLTWDAMEDEDWLKDWFLIPNPWKDEDEPPA